MTRKAWLIGLASIAIVTSTRAAHALGPIGVEIGAKAGAGTTPVSGIGVNPLGFGIGARAGVVLFDHLYGGVNLMYYFGGTSNVGDYAGDSLNMWMYGVEAGWGFTLTDILTIRPQVGLGNASFSDRSPSGSDTATSYLYVEPGLTGVLSLGTLFVGADANGLFFPGLSNGSAAFTLHGQLGVKF